MTADEFSLVTDIKFLGAWNLFQAVDKAGLRFFTALSSVAAIQGNPGQTNYAAANRMMSALLSTLRKKYGAIRFKALMLPPIEGAGMAEDPHVRDLMKRMGVSYIHVVELAGLFCRELFVSPADDDWVLFMRTLPVVKTARLNLGDPFPNGVAEGEVETFRHEDFPMIEGIASLDLAVSVLAGARRSPGSVYRHDPMSSRASTAIQDFLSPGQHWSAGGGVRCLACDPGDFSLR